MSGRRLGWLWLFAILGAAAFGQAPLVDQIKSQLPAGVTAAVLFSDDTAEAFQVSARESVSTSATPAGSGVPFGSSRKVVVGHSFVPVWSALALSKTWKPAVASGHTILVSFWARSPEMTGGRSGQMRAQLEKAAPDWDALAATAITSSASWKQIFLLAPVTKSLPSEGIHLSIHLGLQAQTVELGGLVVLDVATSNPAALPHNAITWPGQDLNAPWRAAAAQRIDTLRRGNLTVRVVDAHGSPLPQATVRVEQVRRAFTFGSFTGHGAILAATPDGEKYRAFYSRLFDRATVPLYWADWGWLSHRDQYREVARWASGQGLAIRGHVLVYPGWQFMPSSTKGLSGADLQKAFLKQIREVSQVMKSVAFREIDVTNELRDLTAVPGLVGREGVAQWFKAAREAFPGVKLALNENTLLTDGGATEANQQIFLDWYRYLKSQGAAPDVLGFQGHFNEAVTDPETVWRILDRFSAETDAELQITEFDINTSNEEAKAAYTRDFLTAVFAHPRVTAVTMWGFWEGDHWIPQAASWNKDWSPRPAGRVLEELLGKTWRTDETWQTGADGTVGGRIWLGTLKVTVGIGAASVTKLVTIDRPDQPQTCDIQLRTAGQP